MREATIRLRDLGLIAGTRVALGIGIGMVLADRVSQEQRKAIGWALVAFGILATVPLARKVLSNVRTGETTPERMGEAT